MNFQTDYKLEGFILDTKWNNLPEKVQVRARVCFIDLICALIIGSRSEQFMTGKKLAKAIFGNGDVAVVGSRERFSFMGAACAMGHSSNAYDIDDGHNIIRAHPGTSFIGGILAAAYEKDISYGELLTTLVISYETTIRMGMAIMDYYNYAHSSGTFGAVGTAAGVGRIYGFTKEQMNNVLSVAEFHAPLVPGIRSVEYPSMNKDGVPFGVMTGTLAVMETLCGFTGNKNLLEAEKYKHYLDDLNEDYEIMKLYFKPYTCCRWAHPAIDACLEVMRINNISYKDIKQVTIHTFKGAAMLSKIVPRTADEAQYNIAYPVAAAIVTGDFGFDQITAEAFENPEIMSMMNKLSFYTDAEIDAQFPERRICRAVITTNDYKQFVSSECEPRGEAKENIGIDWISEKFKRITSSHTLPESQDYILHLMTESLALPVRSLIDEINDKIIG
ncbi:MmgE/PrpD family protein [Sedimentibacter sp.]|uniref:MmgE/PrpD family protein n=1 Tax=Sedimentibacter sp. TaxID=1960295 RepID=UPI0028981A5D|nr:MmgE/PrpD family protein [Sedimentibacter sp.]